MARLGTLKKQPGETLPFKISYAEVIGDEEATSIVPVATMPLGITMAAEAVVGNTYQCWVAGGVDGFSGTVRVVATIEINGNDTIVEDEVAVQVKEIS